MKIKERNNKLKHFISCLKCEVSGKCCNDNCSHQYEAGNMGEIIENLEAISRALEQKPRTAQWVVVIDEIDKFGNKTWHYKCSKCGCRKSGWGDFKHCPDCGRRMYKKRSDM